MGEEKEKSGSQKDDARDQPRKTPVVGVVRSAAWKTRFHFCGFTFTGSLPETGFPMIP